VNYLIDTNVISELRKDTRRNPNVGRWYTGTISETLYLSVLVLGELRKGVEKARARDPAQARALEKWVDQIRKDFSERILPIDLPVVDEWGRMNAIRPLPVIDSLLAATAKVHAMTLVTRNFLDMSNLGVRVLNPFAD
jgi:toxin FitB